MKILTNKLSEVLNFKPGVAAKIESGKFPVIIELLEKLSLKLGFDMRFLPKKI